MAALVASSPGVGVGGAGADAGGGGVPPEAWVNLAANAAILAYVLLGVANTLVASTVARRREVAALRLMGATPGQVRSAVLGESALLTAMAVGAGVALSAIPLVLLGIGFLGRPWPAGPAWVLPVTVLGTAALGLAATALPVRYLLRRPVLA